MVLSPDRLSRKYAYQVLLLEEFAHCGVACEFVESPAAETPQERLLVQVQGMIAEYERALIAERSRRGKRHKARNGSPSVLSGAPYGYRYVKRGEGVEARYEILAGEAEVVRQVFDSYTREQCSIGAIARQLTEQDSDAHGEAALGALGDLGHPGNPAYRGKACYGKTGTGPRQKVTRPLRGPGKFASQQVSGLVRARSGSRSGAGLGQRGAVRASPGAARGEQAACDAADEGANPVAGHAGVSALRLCLLPHFDADDEAEAVLLSLPGLGQVALGRWRALPQSAGAAGPSGRGGLAGVGAVAGRASLASGRAGTAAPGARRIHNGVGWRNCAVSGNACNASARDCSAYQEELRAGRVAQPHAGHSQSEAGSGGRIGVDRERGRGTRALSADCRDAESFRERLSNAETLDVIERQKVLRSLVKEVLVGDEEITIRHSIPIRR